MKYLLLFLISFNLFATVETDMKAMKKLRRRMIKCGFNEANEFVFKNKVIADDDSSKRDCLKSKTAEIATEDAIADEGFKYDRDRIYAVKFQKAFAVSIRLSGVKNVAKNRRLLNKFNMVMKFLNVGDIEGARDELLTINADSEFSQATKDSLVAGMNAYLAQ